MTTIHSLHISSKPLIEFAYQAATRVHHIKPAQESTHQTINIHCIKPTGIQELELPELFLVIMPKHVFH
jgi:hypothetical protein